MMGRYYIHEQSDGRYIVQDGYGRTLIGWDRDCRSTRECYEAIAADWLLGDMSPDVHVTFTRFGDSDA